MNTNPAVAGPILRLFAVVAVAAVGSVFAADKIVSIASRKQMEQRGGFYNDAIHPEQDRLYVPLIISHNLMVVQGSSESLTFLLQRHNFRPNAVIKCGESKEALEYDTSREGPDESSLKREGVRRI
jgi:hypothetical protein